MLLSLADALRQVRNHIIILLEPEPRRRLCRDCGHRWPERVLDPVTTIHLFVLQVLHGNTVCAHLPHLSGIAFTDSTYARPGHGSPWLSSEPYSGDSSSRAGR